MCGKSVGPTRVKLLCIMDAKMSLKIHKKVNYSAPPLTLRLMQLQGAVWEIKSGAVLNLFLGVSTMKLPQQLDIKT